MAPGPDLALYVGEAGNALGDGSELIPHVTVTAVPRGEAEASEQWRACDENGKPLKAAKKAAQAPAEDPPAEPVEDES